MKPQIKALGLAVGLALAATTSASAEQLKFMTGPQGGSWIPLGGQLKDAWEKAIPGLSVQAVPGAGMANVRAVQEGKTDIGFGNSITTVDAVNGKPPFKEPHKNVCNVATLYPQYYQLVVPADAGINSVKDLKGKGVSTQQKGNTGELITKQILQVNGLSYDDVKTSFVGYTDSVNQMKDGHVQAFGLGTTIPAGSIMDIAASRDIKLLDLSSSIDAMKKINPGYNLVTVPKGTYPKQEKDVQVIGYATHVVVSCKMPEEIVYKMTKTIADKIGDLKSVVKAMAKTTPQVMATDVGVPFHPGAAKYYKEAGIATN